MFYSHAILTSREHGVATVWLVATLGSRSSLKSVTRKKILDVDVNKACDTIQSPEAPMALRLQGNLLFGVARVFSQQCGYVLADAQAVREKIRGVSMIVRDLALDPEAGRARPEQLNLLDDPAFLPELDLNFDLSVFDMPTDTSGRSSFMSPPSLVSSRSSQQAEEEEATEPALELSSDDTSLRAGTGGFDLGLTTGLSSMWRSESRPPGLSVLDEETGILDVGWEFDEHGNMIETDKIPKSNTVIPSAGAGSRSRRETDSAISARVRLEHAEGLEAAQQALEFDDGIMAVGEDEHNFLRARPSSPDLPADGADAAYRLGPTSPAQPPEEETPSTAISAPQQRARAAKVLDFDERPGLTNDELRQWNEGYLRNMHDATNAKHSYRLAHQAKKNAEQWVLGQGIGSVGSGVGQDHAAGPLQMFSGASLLAALTGRGLSPAGTKHARSSSVRSTADKDKRHVRAREEGDRLGRGAGDEDLTLAGHDEGLFAGGDELDIEMGRTAADELPERRSSQMPWELYSASRQGSTRPFGSAEAGLTSSVGGPLRGFELGHSSVPPRRGSRLTAASPLQGRGPPLPSSQRISILSTPDREELTVGGAFGDDDDEMMGGELPPLGDESEDFQLHGPAAAMDTQTAAQSDSIAAALDSESRKFLDFLDAQLPAHVHVAEEKPQDEGPMPKRSATFESLLPPTEYTSVVAAQAFLHVLTLASKNLVNVKQQEEFGDIVLALIVEG